MRYIHIRNIRYTHTYMATCDTYIYRTYDTYIHTYIRYIHACIHTYWCSWLTTTKSLRGPSEGIVGADGAGRTVHGVFNLRRPNVDKKLRVFVVGSPTLWQPDFVKRSPVVWQPLSPRARPTQAKEPDLETNIKKSKHFAMKMMHKINQKNLSFQFLKT